MPGDLLDLILIAVIAAFAVAGYRQGFIIGVLSLVGFVAGIALGAYIAPGISRALATRASWQAFLAILVVFVIAVIGMLIASGIGVTVRSRLNGRQLTFADSLGGWEQPWDSRTVTPLGPAEQPVGWPPIGS